MRVFLPQKKKQYIQLFLLQSRVARPECILEIQDSNLSAPYTIKGEEVTIDVKHANGEIQIGKDFHPSRHPMMTFRGSHSSSTCCGNIKNIIGKINVGGGHIGGAMNSRFGMHDSVDWN